MREFKSVWHDEVPPELCDGHGLKDDFNRDRSAMVEFVDGKPIRVVAWDGGEPEDQIFSRDLGWISEALNCEASEIDRLRADLKASNANEDTMAKRVEELSDENGRLRSDYSKANELIGDYMAQLQQTQKENAALKEKYQGQRPKCHSGHENILPLALWDCPMCSDKLRKENVKLREALELERERCAKIAEEYRKKTWTPDHPIDGVEIARLIRAGK